MPEFDDELLVPLRDVRALADLGLNPQQAPATEERVRRRIVAALTGPPARRRLRRLSRRGAGLLGVGILLAGGTAIAATAPWSPQLGAADRGHATLATTAVPGDQTAALAVLRRPQTDADRTPEVEALLKLVMAPRQFGGVHLDSLRLLAKRPEGIAVLVAAERTGTNDPGYPPEVRHDQLCLLTSSNHSWVKGKQVPMKSAGAKCGTVADIAAGKMMMGAQWEGRMGASGLVPDGVTRVEIPLTGGPTLKLDVVNNTYFVETAVPVGRFNPNTVRWLDAAGQEVPRKGR